MSTAARLAELRGLVAELIDDPDDLGRFVATLEPDDAVMVEHVVDEITGRLTYRDDPERWADECIVWPEGQGLTRYQRRALRKLKVHKRLAIKSLHGVGKTTLAAIIILWFATTRDDWKAPTTASVWRQLSKYLWPEVHKWHGRIRWDRLGRKPFRRKVELLDLAIKLEGGEAFAVASDDASAIEGVHAESVLYVIDEGKAVPDDIYDAAEGALSGTGEVYAFVISTPGKPVGRFFDIMSRKPGYEDWATMSVTLADAIEAGRVDPEWAAQKAKQWGEHSPVYRNRVLGEFADADETSVIPLEWVEAANERWRTWRDDHTASGLVTAAGVDVARYGDDKTVIALRAGDVVARIDSHGKIPTTETLGYCKGYSSRWPAAVFVVDVIGVGAGVVDGLREWNAPTVAFVANGRTAQRDRTGSFGFDSARSAAWWSLRELLDPQYGSTVALPPDDELTGDLTAPAWEVTSGGKIKVESKKDFKQRLGRSPDKGDAVVMAFVADMARATFAQAPPSARRRDDDANVLTMNF